MTPGELVLIRPGRPGALLDELARVRGAGGVPLMADDRWSPEHAARVADAAARAPRLRHIGWATMTGGSSGMPRIVLRTSASWSDGFGVVAEMLDAAPGDIVALPAPPVSSLTLVSLAHALEGGPEPRLATGHALVAADFADATLFHGTPQAFRALLEQGAPPRLRSALIGGSHVDASLRERATAAGIRVVSYYGAAELSYVAADHGDGLRPLPGVDIDIRDGNELWVRSPFVADSYAHAPLRRDGDWVTVGDRAELHDGRLHLLGRSDDAILTSSATVVPEEVEATLRSFPGVADAVVMGIADARLGARLVAVIEPRPGQGPTVADLREQARRALSPSHRPRAWYTATVPRTAAGKPARGQLRERIEAGEVHGLE